MAKKKKSEAVEVVEAPKAALETSEAAAEAAVVEVSTKFFVVSVNCPTPLARNPAFVQAVDADGAWSVFCGMNGITSSDHAREIVEADPSAPEGEE